MAMRAEEIEAMILAAFPDAVVEIRDLAGDGDHYSARVVSADFAGMSRVRQHQAVYAALKGKMGNELHALQLETLVPTGDHQ
jgi:stress-induced morphogen